MLDFDPNPSFSRFLDVLLLRRAYIRPPAFDFHVALAHRERLIGRKIEKPQDDVGFFLRAGYDYVQCTLHVFSQELIEASKREHQRGVSMPPTSTSSIRSPSSQPTAGAGRTPPKAT